jgi:tripartite-type tricarboxylate transporter receptor subunit TctC
MARIATSGGILSKADGTNYQFVPYRGAAPVIQDLLASFRADKVIE